MKRTHSLARQCNVGRHNWMAIAVSLVCAACLARVDPSPSPAPPQNPPAVPTQTPPSFPGPTPSQMPASTPAPTSVSTELFDGSFYGWRFAPDEVLRAEGLDRNLSVDCEPREYGEEHQTDLDFHADYLPAGQRTSSVVKWACGDVGLSVVEEYSFAAYPGSTVTLQRALWGSKSADLWAPAAFVRACEVGGKPAVCVHYLDDGTGRGGHLAQIIVLERASLDPHALVFRLSGVEIPFAELMAIMTSVVGD